MGAVSFSIDLQLVQILKRALPLSIFVETGTFEGESVRRVRPLFRRLYTVELADKYYAMAEEQFKDDPGISVYQGSSPQFIQNLNPILKDESVLYWLDSHWCVADATAGEESQCPLLQELESIHRLNSQSVILIDDARLFLCPPPIPYKLEGWPNFDAIYDKLRTLSINHEFLVINDVIVYFPSSIRAALREYAHLHSIDWLTVLSKARDYELLRTQLEVSEADRAARLDNRLDARLQSLEGKFAARILRRLGLVR